jgi:transcription factor IIIB subunit 2
MRTARMLYDLTTLESRISTGTSAGATACALLLLSLEAHAGPPRPVPHALVLAAQLGAAIGARGAAVMARYRMLMDIIEADAARVPWLAGASTTGSKRVSRRSCVAKAVLDVLQFHNQLEQAEIAQRGGPIGVEIEGDDDGDSLERGNQGEDEAALDAQIATVELKMTDSTGSMLRAHRDMGSTTGTMGPVRRYKKLRTATTQAASFLLDPLAHCAPARATLAHTTYLLSSDTASEPAVPPTRLQLLAVDRGNAEAIHDDELFSDGELEGIVIGTDEQAGEERERRARALQMVWGDEDAEATEEDLGVEAVQAGRMKKRKAQVDMNKLAAFLDSDDPFVALGIEESSPSDEGGGEAGDGQGFFRQLEDAEWE